MRNLTSTRVIQELARPNVVKPQEDALRERFIAG